MDKVWEMTLAIFASVGGAGAIITGIVALCTNLITKKLEQKYAHLLNEKLETLKSELRKKEYVSKTRFDAEFEIHRALSKAFFELAKAISVLIPNGYAELPADPEVRKKYEDQNYIDAHTASVVAQDVLNQNAPFILKEFFDEYHSLLKLSKQQLAVFSERYDVNYLVSQEKKSQLSSDDYRRTGELINKHAELNDKVRDYLKSLEVAE